MDLLLQIIWGEFLFISGKGLSKREHYVTGLYHANIRLNRLLSCERNGAVGRVAERQFNLKTQT